MQPKEPDDLDVEGLLKGIYHFSSAPQVKGNGDAPRVQLLASGVGVPWVIEAQRLLAEDWGVAADVWSVTSWNELGRDAVAAEEWNLLHPSESRPDAVRHGEAEGRLGPVRRGLATTCAAVQNQIAKWVPGDFHALGADGFGFADTRPAARRYFQIDAQSVVVQALQALADRGEVKAEVVQEAFDDYQIDDPTAVSDVKQEGGDA